MRVSLFRPDDHSILMAMAHFPHEPIYTLRRRFLGTPTGYTDEVKKKVFDPIDDFLGKVLEL
jgi:hypothetical protein